MAWGALRAVASLHARAGRSRRARRATAAVVLAGAGVLSLPTLASAATFTVTTQNDSSDGSCTASLCSLRDAVVAADAASGSSTIQLPAGDYKLTIPSTGPNDPTNGDLDVQAGNSVTIEGAGSGSTTVDANSVDRAFGVQSGASLTLSGMTITGGRPASASSGDRNGGAIYSDGALALTGDMKLISNSTLPRAGGAIYSDSGATLISISGADIEDNHAGVAGALLVNGGPTATQVIANSVFRRNTASSGGGAVQLGGGDLTITGTTFSGNLLSSTDGGAVVSDAGTSLTADGDSFVGNFADSGGALAIVGDASISASTFSGNGATNGGAIWQDSSGTTFSLVNSTLSGNSATNGGGIYNAAATAAATIENDTIASNWVSASSGAGGGIWEPGNVAATSKYVNTIVADNVGNQCYDDTSEGITATQDQGHNLDGDGTCFGPSGGPGDQTGVDPKLGPLQDNGGPTMTQAPLPGSLAIDAGDSTAANCPANDQRGVPRPQGSACDVGAFEVSGADVGVSESAPATAAEGAPLTYTLSVTNSGPGPATGVVLTDRLSPATSFFASGSSQGSCGGSATVTCSLGVVNVGSTVTVTIAVIPNTTGTATNSASVAANETDPETANNNASATTKLTLGPPTVSPVVVTGRANGVGRHSATLSGAVNPAGKPATWRFLYGRSQAYGRSTRARFAGQKLRQREVSAVVRGLRPGQLYHYRLVATNAYGSSFGADKTFRTPSRRTSHVARRAGRRHRYVLPTAWGFRIGW